MVFGGTSIVAGLVREGCEKFDAIQKGQSMNICYHIEENEWNGNVSLQLNIKDIKKSE